MDAAEAFARLKLSGVRFIIHSLNQGGRPAEMASVLREAGLEAEVIPFTALMGQQGCGE